MLARVCALRVCARVRLRATTAGVRKVHNPTQSSPRKPSRAASSPPPPPQQLPALFSRCRTLTPFWRLLRPPVPPLPTNRKRPRRPLKVRSGGVRAGKCLPGSGRSKTHSVAPSLPRYSLTSAELVFVSAQIDVADGGLRAPYNVHVQHNGETVFEKQVCPASGGAAKYPPSFPTPPRPTTPSMCGDAR